MGKKKKRCKKCTNQFIGDGEECPECKAGIKGDAPTDSGEKEGTSTSANRKWCAKCNDVVDVLPPTTQTLRAYCSKCKQYNTLWEFPPPVLVTPTRDLSQSPPLQGQAGASATPASKGQVRLLMLIVRAKVTSVILQACRQCNLHTQLSVMVNYCT